MDVNSCSGWVGPRGQRGSGRWAAWQTHQTHQMQPTKPDKPFLIAAWRTHQIHSHCNPPSLTNPPNPNPQYSLTDWPMQPAKPRVWCKLTNKSTNHRLGISINQNASQCIPRRNAFVTNLILVIHQCDPSTARRLQSLFSQLSQSFINFSLCWRIFLLILTFVLAFAWAFQSWALVVVTLSFTPVVGLDSPPTFCYKNIILGTFVTFHYQTSRLDQHNSLRNLCILKDEENPRRDVGTFGDNLPIVLR